MISKTMKYEEIFRSVKAASQGLALVHERTKSRILCEIADAILERKDRLLAANAEDLWSMDRRDPLYDRLLLTESRLADIACDMRRVAGLPSPSGGVIEARTLPNGLRLRRVSVPFGVVGVIYEARPNVTIDVFSLCFKTGNACILKGGSNAARSNEAIVRLIHGVLAGWPECRPSVVELLPPTHEAAEALLSAVGYVDLCIPRGGKSLIRFVRDTARVPVIETGAGVVSAYFDTDGDVSMGARIINNAKTRRVSVCNALDCLIVHRSRLADLPTLCAPLAASNVVIYADAAALSALRGRYPDRLLREVESDSYGTEFMDYAMSVKTVPSFDAALGHIAAYGSGHSECIITQNAAAAHEFERRVDAACVYWNAPTSFTDGGQFGLGAEIGISTQKLGPRGPMGLEALTTYKWIIEGEGQVRE